MNRTLVPTFPSKVVSSRFPQFMVEMQLPRMLFGRGSLQSLRAEIDAIGVSRVFIISTPGRRGNAETAADLLGTKCAEIFDEAVTHRQAEVAEDATDVVTAIGADCVLAICGGSTTSIAKAVMLSTGLPVVAVPTTYAGSEMTPVRGMSRAGGKSNGRVPQVLPRTVIYDVELSRTLPIALTVASGINAIAHAVEALYAPDRNPVTDMVAQEGIGAMASGLRLPKRSPGDVTGRQACLYGAWLCGTAFGNVRMGLHHQLCHALGGMLKLPHVLTYNAAATPQAMAAVAHALGEADAAGGIFQLAAELGAETALRAIGMHEADIERCVEAVLDECYPNPRPVERQPLCELLCNAYWGVRP